MYAQLNERRRGNYADKAAKILDALNARLPREVAKATIAAVPGSAGVLISPYWVAIIISGGSSLMFKSGLDFVHFTEAVRTQFRYVHSDQVREFLTNLVASSIDRTTVLAARSRLWRAQLGCATRERVISDPNMDVVYPEDIPLDRDRMKPQPNAAYEGRVNPKGIPCFYLATDKDTAMAEVRPWLEAKLSVACFLTTRDIKVVDCSKFHDRSITPDVFFGRGTPAEVTDGVWTLVDHAFSKPIVENPSTAEYIPTQIIAEAFHRERFDGLLYKSRLGSGTNVALFDLGAAEFASSCLYSTSALKYEFKLECSP